MKKEANTALAAAALLLLATASGAQPPAGSGGSSAPGPPDGTVLSFESSERRVTPYPYIGEHDLMWSARIWRYIDLKEKMNLPLAYPRSSHKIHDRQNLFDVIHDAVLEGTITAYEPYDGLYASDEFTDPISILHVRYLGAGTPDTFFVENPLTDIPETLIVNNPFDRDRVVKFKVKEDWYFDKKRSVMEVRIIGIAPVIQEFSESGEYLGERDFYWVYFPELRHLLARREVFNRFNDAQRLTYDDLFQKRMFSSYIIKRSNVYDRWIKDYRTGMDALLEAEDIRNDIFTMEHDLWEY